MAQGMLMDGPVTMRGWFAALAEGGQVVDDLQKRTWGAFDGTIRFSRRT